MKRIEDIRPVKKNKRLEESPAIVETESEFPAEMSSPAIFPAAKNHSPKHKTVGKRIGRFLIYFFLFLAIGFFCLVSLYLAKNKIEANFENLSADFSAMSKSLSNKDLISAESQISNLNQKTADSELILQSVGQNLIVLDLLYPKGKSSQVTEEIDAVRAAHLLTASFVRIGQIKNSPTATTSPGDYLGKINNYLSSTKNFLAALPNNLFYAQIFAAEAKGITDSLNPAKFTPNQKSAVNNLARLSGVSVDFFAYLSDLQSSLSKTLTISGPPAGGQAKKSYLILFLNNAEEKPGGGFIGSFARLDLQNGKAVNLDFEKNIYTLDQAYTASHQTPPPAEYTTITPTMEMRDSNYFADFADSSKNVINYYQKESGQNVDGLIAIDTTLFRQLLSATGPINMPEYNLTVTDQNFLTAVQYQVEVAYFQSAENKAENQPKKILADMMPKLVAAMFKNSATEKLVAKAISSSISEKHLLFYFSDPNIEDLIDGINAGGKIHDDTGDYLYLSDTNLGGMKSSLKIQETVNQNVAIADDGNVSEQLSIQREHTGDYTWPDGTNANFVKVYLPLAARINSVSGSNLSGPGTNLTAKTYGGKSYVGFWQTTKPGETSQSNLDYSENLSIPANADSFDWKILIQKQPGIESFQWNLNLVYPVGWKPQNVVGYDAAKRKINLSETIKKDSVFDLRFVRD